jgi:hypothetical protein
MIKLFLRTKQNFVPFQENEVKKSGSKKEESKEEMIKNGPEATMMVLLFLSSLLFSYLFSISVFIAKHLKHEVS